MGTSRAGSLLGGEGVGHGGGSESGIWFWPYLRGLEGS